MCGKSCRQVKFEDKWSQKANPFNQIFVFVYNDANICSQEWSAVLLSSKPSPSPAPLTSASLCLRGPVPSIDF